MKIFKIILLMLFLVALSGCTTTSKKLTKTEKIGDKSALFAQAQFAYSQKRFNQSAKILQLLSEQGYTRAQYALGYMYYRGEGVPRNNKQATQWLSMAAAKGDKKSIEALRLLSLSRNQAASTDGQPALIDLTTKKLSSKTMPIVEKPNTVEMIVVEDSQLDVSRGESLKPKLIEEVEALKKEESVGEVEVVKEEKIELEKVGVEHEEAGNASKLSDAELWIMDQPADFYTIQIIATDNESALKYFIKSNSLSENSVYYRTRNSNGKSWFTLIQGSFETLSSANAVIKQFSLRLKEKKPWVKPIAGIQKKLSAR